jgi:GlcNAc-P-P-Und epimerase
MNIVVSGGSGFIGTRLVEELLSAGHVVRIFDKRPSSQFPELVTIGDVRDAAALTTATRGADAVYQLAAEHADDVSPVSLYYDVNVGGARNTVTAAVANGIERLVFTSSVAIYGLDRGTPAENCDPQPFNDYGRSKLEAEEIFGEWATGDSARSMTVVRPVVVFGEGNRGNVFNLIDQIRRGRFLMVGAGRNRKSMAYVGNVAPFLAHAVGLGQGHHVFNYADKPDLSVAELVSAVRAELGLRPSFLRLPYFVGLAGGAALDVIAKLTGRTFPISTVRVRKFCGETTVDASRAHALGLKPRYTLSDGLRLMLHDLDRGRADALTEPGRKAA